MTSAEQSAINRELIMEVAHSAKTFWDLEADVRIGRR